MSKQCRTTISALVTVICTVLLSSCGVVPGQQNAESANVFDTSTPQKTVEGFLRALGNGDQATALKYVTPSARPEDDFIPQQLIKKASNRISEINVGEAENSKAHGTMVSYSYKADGHTVKGKAAVKSSPDGGYRLRNDPDNDSDDRPITSIDDFMPPIGFSSKALNVEETARILPGTYDLSLEPSWGTLEMTVHANGTHEPGNTVTIEYGKMKISNKSNLIERLRKIMIENLEDWNETKNDSDSTFRADQMTWEVTSIQQVPHDYSLLAFDAKGSFPYTFLTFQRTKNNTMSFGGPEDLQGHFIIGVDELTDILGAESTTSTVSFTQHDIDSITIDNRSEVIFAYPQEIENGYSF